MKYVMTFFITLSLSGCAMQQALYEAQLKNWKGKHSEELLMAWGRPAMVQPFAKDREVYLYQYNRTTKKPGEQGYISYKNIDGTMQPVRHGHKQPRLRSERCEYRFVILPNGLIESVRWRGNGCTA